MREGRWYLGLPGKASPELDRRLETILGTLNKISEQLLYFEQNLFNGALEASLEKLASQLEEIWRMGVVPAYSYAEKARLLARYVKAYRVRAEEFHTLRGLSSVRDDVLSHISDIKAFINGLRAYLR